ncbi:hypothetical protein LINPERPRIM_LOCUS17388 [Linum perenne]
MKETLVSIETTLESAATRSTLDQISSPRISFSSEFLDDNNFISITPNHHNDKDTKAAAGDNQFEFLSSGGEPKAGHARMLTADELFFEGKLLPFWQMQQSERLNKITLKCKEGGGGEDEITAGGGTRMRKAMREVNWFVDDDPSPRPPKCTVLWKELLRLKKQRPVSSLSPSSSSSSTSSSSSSLGDVATKEEGKEKKGNQVKRPKKGLERTRSTNIRIRPMINVPICSQMKSSSHHHSALPPFFPLKKGRVLER